MTGTSPSLSQNGRSRAASSAGLGLASPRLHGQAARGEQRLWYRRRHLAGEVGELDNGVPVAEQERHLLACETRVEGVGRPRPAQGVGPAHGPLERLPRRDVVGVVEVPSAEQPDRPDLGGHRAGLLRHRGDVADGRLDVLVALAAGPPLDAGQGGQHVAAQARLVERLGHRQRLDRDLARRGEVTHRVERPGVHVEGARPQRRRLVGDQPQRLGGGVARVEPALRVEDRRDHRDQQLPPPGGRRVGGEALEQALGQRQRPGSVAGDQQRVDGPGAEGRQVDRHLLREGGVGQQLEGRLVVPGRLVRAADGHRLVAGADAGVERRGEVVGRAGRAGPARRRCPARGCRRARWRRPRAAAPARRAAGRRRPPRRAARAGTRRLAPRRHQHVVVRRRARRPTSSASSVTLLLGRQQVVGDPAAGHGGGADDGLGLVVEPVEAHQQQLGEVVGQRRAASLVAPTSSSTKNALPSARSTMPAISASVSGVGWSWCDQGADVVVGQRVELHAGRRRGCRAHSAAAGAAGGGGGGRRCGRRPRSPPGPRTAARTGS